MDTTNGEETTLEKRNDEKMAEYDSSQEADYVPESRKVLPRSRRRTLGRW